MSVGGAQDLQIFQHGDPIEDVPQAEQIGIVDDD